MKELLNARIKDGIVQGEINYDWASLFLDRNARITVKVNFKSYDHRLKNEYQTLAKLIQEKTQPSTIGALEDWFMNEANYF